MLKFHYLLIGKSNNMQKDKLSLSYQEFMVRAERRDRIVQQLKNGLKYAGFILLVAIGYATLIVYTVVF